jgi:dephospho-CoA kinase
VEKDVQVSRLSLRDGVDSAAAGALLDLQMTDGEKRILADYIIDNNHGEAELMEKCSELYLLISQDEAVRSDDEKDH